MIVMDDAEELITKAELLLAKPEAKLSGASIDFLEEAVRDRFPHPEWGTAEAAEEREDRNHFLRTRLRELFQIHGI